MATLVKKKSDAPPIDVSPVHLLPSMLAVLIYGRSGTGKTTIASTFPKPILLLDIREKGTDSISNVENIDAGQVSDWEQFEQVYWYLQSGHQKYKTVVIDQVSQLQDLAVAQAMKDDGKDPTEKISQRNWGQAAGLMKTWMLNYRDLIDQGIHVVFLAHDRTTEGDENQEDQIDPVVGARLMPSVASFLNGAVKIIGNTYIREFFQIEGNKKVRHVEYAMRIGPHSHFTTKTRSPVGVASPDSIVNPSFDKMVAVMKGEYREEEEEQQPTKRKPIKQRK